MIALKLERGSAEDALGAVDYETICYQLIEETTKVLNVLSLQQKGNQDVIDVHEDVRDISKDGVPHKLEVLASFLESEWHEQELEEVERHDNCGLVDVFRSYWHLMVTLVEVDFGEDCLLSYVGIEIRDETDGVAVILGDRVEAPVVST